ncbi:MAG: Unknown protein [uncultured Sulfurovum sp.]|uniref:Type II secretion system protein n=1 Tax=uncultured Sulfurovum sp. TaxID=269237 RepID=A0A6S6SSM7_9BACT|nr:MAG: Unknown protein [uncultured Sulfurovum sp.]
MKKILIKKAKKAFSLIEVIFVLVILGIVASISSQIIIQVYENYIMQRAIYNVSTKTELVANQIVNRLSYRIQGTTISKRHQDFLSSPQTVSADSWLPLRDTPTGEEYTTIEWIGYDNDSFAANQQPNWSGIANYETNASRTGFTSPGSNLNNVATIMTNLSNGKVNLTSTNPAAVIFAEDDNFYVDSNEYNPLCMGLIPEVLENTDCIFPVARNGTDGFTFSRDQDNNNIGLLPKIITERYKLAWSAYSLAPETNADGQTDLMLYSNYQPWNNENYIEHGSKNILLPNVTVFKFSENGGVINFKLCASENIGQDFNVTTCKQKVVIR